MPIGRDAFVVGDQFQVEDPGGGGQYPVGRVLVESGGLTKGLRTADEVIEYYCYESNHDDIDR